MQKVFYGFSIAILLLFASCSSRVRYLDELDLTVLENSKHLSEDAILAYLRGKYIAREDSSFLGSHEFGFYPVLVCGIPCRLFARGSFSDSTRAIESYSIECSYDYFERFADSVAQKGDEYSEIFRSKTALQDSLLSRLKRKYGDWDSSINENGHYIPVRDVRLRSISVVVRPRLHSRWPLDTSTSISLYDSAFYVRYFQRQW